MTGVTGDRHDQTFRRYIDRTMAIAHAGIGRAKLLDAIASALLVVGVLAVVVVTWAATGIDDMTEAEQWLAILGGVSAALVCFVGAIGIFGFGALVRNSSRSLELQALESSLLDEP